jgi:hypothetical protein
MYFIVDVWYHSRREATSSIDWSDCSKNFSTKVDGTNMVMQREQMSPHDQNILEEIEGAWQHQKDLSPDAVKHIIELVITLPEEHKNIGLRVIAGKVTGAMNLHLLELIETFRQNAEQESIRSEECEETLKYTLPVIFSVMKKVSDQIVVQSLDDLVTLINITVSLQVFSTTDLAEDAQNWLFELPSLYYNRLVKEKLVVDKHDNVGVWIRSPSYFSDKAYAMHGSPFEPVMMPTKKVPMIPQNPISISLSFSSNTLHA